MTETMDRFAAQCRTILKEDSGPKGREKVKSLLEDLLSKGDLAELHLGPGNKSPRTLLYQDPDLGFCILAHAHDEAKDSDPHDHGPSWAIYGQAAGTTEMIDWRKVQEPKDGQPGRCEEVRRYALTPGTAYVYNEGDLHSPKRSGPTRLIRLEGMNMETVKRDKYLPA